MKRTSVIPFARVEKVQRYAGGVSVQFLLLVTRAGRRNVIIVVTFAGDGLCFLKTF